MKGVEEGWEWLDAKPWTYQNWASKPELGYYEPLADPGHACMTVDGDGYWWSKLCDLKQGFICANHPIKMIGTHTLVFKNPSLENQVFHFWWDESTADTQGLKLNWHIENGSLPDVRELVSNDLEGSVSSPGLGSLPPTNFYKEMHEYTAVIELPHNITAVIGDGALIIDVVLADDQKKNYVQLLTGAPSLEHNNLKMTWSAAEEFCVSKGGILPLCLLCITGRS